MAQDLLNPIYTATFAQDDEESPDLHEIFESIREHLLLAEQAGKKLVIQMFYE